MEKANRSLLSLLTRGFRRYATLGVFSMLLFSALLTSCRAAARVDATPGPRTSLPAVSAAAASAHAGCGQGLLVASAWECLRTGLPAPRGDAQP